MSVKSCPLCRSSDVVLREMIPTEHLMRIYREQLGIDVAGHFTNQPVLRFVVCRECGLRYFHPAVTGSDAFYQALQGIDWYYMANKWEFRVAAGYIRPQDSVLEVGCGRGHFATVLSCGAYVGLETSASAIVLAGEVAAKLCNETVEAHAQDHAEAYDVVCSFQVLEHVADPAGFLDACIRSLKPRGVLLLSTPNADSFVTMVVNYGLNLPPHHVSHWPEQVWRSLERLYPLSLERLVYEPLQAYHYEHYSRTVMVALARQLAGARGDRLVDFSPQHEEALGMADNMREAALKVFADPRLSPSRGHTVFAMYRKTE